MRLPLTPRGPRPGARRLDGQPPSDDAPARPSLRPAARWARWALLLLMAFALMRGDLMAVTVPAFFAPDEDYHFLYMEHLARQGSVVEPGEAIYSREFLRANAPTKSNYGLGPRTRFTGDPKAQVRALSHPPPALTEPRFKDRGVGVVHPPLYHALGAGVVGALDGHAILTRLFWVRVMTSVLGALGVYAAWLLAAQVFRREPMRLLAAFLFAVQPLVAYLAGIANHDSLLIALFTLSLAMMLFVLRTPPRPRQGLWLAAPIASALMVKGSALALLPLAGLALLGQGLTYRRWGAVLRSGALGLALVLAVAGWWYVRSKLRYDSWTGAAAAPTGGAAVPGRGSPGDLLRYAREWTGLTYRTYWFHYLDFDAPNTRWFYRVPIFVGLVGIVGLGVGAVRARRTLLDPRRPALRQGLLLLAAALAVYLPFMAVDVMRRTTGAGFLVIGGRYLLPAYGGVAVLFLLGLRALVPARARTAAFVGVALGAAAFAWEVYSVNYLHRYFGAGPLGDLFARMSFDRPALVTRHSIWVLFALMLASLAGAAALVGLGARRERPARDDGPTASGPEPAPEPRAAALPAT